MNNQEGQSGLQVLMVLSILLFIATFSTIFILNIQKKARDSERITILITLQKSLDLYFDTFNKWPKGDDDGQGWDEGFHSKSDRRFIQPLVDHKYISLAMSDPKFYGAKSIKYTSYDAGSNGCPVDKGMFYVLGISELESDTRPPTENTGSGFACSGRDWGKEFDYVVGKFER